MLTSLDYTRSDNGRLGQTGEKLIPRPATVTDNVRVLCQQRALSSTKASNSLTVVSEGSEGLPDIVAVAHDDRVVLEVVG